MVESMSGRDASVLIYIQRSINKRRIQSSIWKAEHVRKKRESSVAAENQDGSVSLIAITWAEEFRPGV